MNGSVHHRHTLNLSTISNASSKAGKSNNPVLNESKLSATGGSNLIETNNVTPVVDSIRNTSVLQSKLNYSHVSEILRLLTMLSIVSVLLAFLSVVFFLKITPFIEIEKGGNAKRFLSGEECKVVHEVVLGLLMCTVSLDFTCFLICAAQCLFASKLLKVAQGVQRASRYLQCGSCSRGIAVCGFFISVPVFITALILYAFIHFQNTSAVITTSLLGGGILISGVSIIYNAHLWQKELATPIYFDKTQGPLDVSTSTNPDSTPVPQMELSTLV